jgi:hypothetical protein
MSNQNRPPEWIKLISLKYKSTTEISKEKYELLISSISKITSKEIYKPNEEFVFPLTLVGVKCMCAIVLITQNPITECQFVVMTKEGKKPSNMNGIEPIHLLIEQVFLKF